MIIVFEVSLVKADVNCGLFDHVIIIVILKIDRMSPA